MDGKIFNHLLAKVILYPFTQIEFVKNDLLLNYTIAYKELINFENSKLTIKREKLKNKMNIAQKNILKTFARDYRWSHLDDAQMLINMFYSGHILMNYLSDDKKDINRFYLEHIYNIASTFITFRDGIVSFRSWYKEEDALLKNYTEFDKIELWNHISRSAAVDLFIAASYVTLDYDDIDFMYNVPNLIYLADMPLKLILNKGVAETHLHANAAISYQFLWLSYTSLFYHKQKNNKIWFCTLFKFHSAYFIESQYNTSFEKYVDLQFEGEMPFKSSLNYFNKLINDLDNTPETSEKNVECFNKEVYSFYNADQSKANDLLFDTIYINYKDKGTSSEIIWYYKILRYLKTNYDPFLCECFIKYIRLKNDFYVDKVQQTAIGGLDYFKEFYNKATKILRNPKVESHIYKKQNYYSIFEEQCKTGNLSILEMKISPKIGYSSNVNKTSMMRNTLDQIKVIVNAYNSYINNRLEVSKNKKLLTFPKLGLMYHFIKENDSDNFSGYNCIMYDRSSYVNCYDYNTMRKRDIEFLKALIELLSNYPILTDYVVGIDAASVENATEPWVFAPVFRHARSHYNVIPYSPDTSNNIQNMGFTYHVGEDFRHIISGLRHIDEVLTHFDYRSGDRLGHAIALGIDIENWVKQNRIVAIPIMEHLENLLWMWKYVNSNRLGNAPENLEFKIMELAQKIYSNKLNGIDVYKLWCVYQAKFNENSLDLNKCTSSNNICTLKDKLTSDSFWKTNELVLSHFCPCYNEIYNEPIFVSLNEDDIYFYTELQNTLISKVEKMGVYVETNPSSNSVIGDIPSILQHPILRLNNKGLNIEGLQETCVLASINSDDPIVFSTFVENEIAYIYYSLLNAGCKREDALKWIDKIRQHGVNSSFVKNNKTYNEMQHDFDEINKITI